MAIEAMDNHWVIKSNDSINIIENNVVVENVTLYEYYHTQATVFGRKEILNLYCLPTIETNIAKLVINTEQITIGSSRNCSIVYQQEQTNPVHAGIYKQNNKWYVAIPNETTYSPIYLNDKLVTSRREITAGDIIFINGLKIIWMKNFIVVNNPNNLVSYNNSLISPYKEQITDNTRYIPINEEEEDIELYTPEDYFYHTPNLKEYVKPSEIRIDDPPQSELKQDNGLLATSASLTMIASTFVSGFNIFNNVMNGASLKTLLPSTVMFGAMLVGSVILPRITTAYNKVILKNREKYRVNKYTEYLQNKEKEIIIEMERQKQILNANNPNIENCINLINGKTEYLWTREIKDEDFLEVKLGIGNKEANIKINAAEEHFTLENDKLYNKIYEIVNASRKLENVPITYSLCKSKISAIICDCSYHEDYINSIISQLAIYHSAQDLKIAFLTNSGKFDFEYAKYLPHTFSDDKKNRFFSKSSDEMKSISAYLEKILSNRIASSNQNKTGETEVAEEKELQTSYRKYDTYYLVITDNFTNTKTLPIIDKILESDDNYGFSLLIFDDSIKKLPNRCKSFVSVLEKEGVFIEKDLNTQSPFVPEYMLDIPMRDICRRLMNIPLLETDAQSTLPTSLNFLDMYNVSKIEQLNIVNRWSTSDPTFSLATPIGVHTSGEIFYLDLHEKYHGPHGLIAGSTGSGKSEFIITFVLSMCVNFHPDEVQFVLIDYKGGGLTGAFENKELNQVVPHIAGTITNLDTSEINRSLVSINSELKRRQKKFNEAKSITGESTIDIYKYQRYYREGIIKEPISHLFIVSDEFAELKAQEPEFMDELISTSRIGRSLGVHLILATQKPAGVVNEQIWSNSKFKICLKVANKNDSMEMLKRPEAASIKETGRFYLQIGYDEYFDIGQSGWSGAKYVPADKMIKQIDDSISFINNTGSIIKNANNIIKKENKVEYGDQLTNITKKLMEIAKEEDFHPRKLWLDKLPEFIYIGNLKQKYNISVEPYVINPVIGEYDDPAGQKQDCLRLNLSEYGNTVIYGQNGAGQDTLLSTILFSTSLEHRAEEVNFYIIDLGGETLKTFNKMPTVGDVCTIEETEKITNLFVMLDEELDRRKKLFADYNGEYNYYIKKAEEKLPFIVCIINNYDAFVETFSKMNEMLASFYRECAKYGITFIITCASQTTIRSKVAEYFRNKMCLRMAKDEDYRNILNAKKGLIPANYKGRGIVKLDSECYEFQTAYIYLPDQINEVIKNTIENLASANTYKIKRVPVLPDIVTLNLIESEYLSLKQVPIGIDVNKKTIFCYNFKMDKINLIISENEKDLLSFIYPLSIELSSNSNTKIKVIDFTKKVDALKIGGEITSSDVNDTIVNISNEIAEKNQDGFERVYLFLGLSEAKKALNENNYQLLKDIFNLPKDNRTTFIVLDEYENIKKLEIESWYINNINKNNGIWLGPGIGTQNALIFKGLSSDVRRINISDMAFVSMNDEIYLIRKVVDNGEESRNEQ